MFERFTEPARHVVVLAQEEARELQHNYIGTEHILLGLLRGDDGVAALALESLGLSLADGRAEVVRIVGRGEEVTAGQIPFTPRAKKALELALREALGLSHDYIDTEHILLGLLRDCEGVAVRVLLDLGTDPETVRNEVVRLLPHSQRQRQSQAGSGVTVKDVRFMIGPDRDLRRLLMAAAAGALRAERTEFSLADVLAAADEVGRRAEPPDAEQP